MIAFVDATIMPGLASHQRIARVVTADGKMEEIVVSPAEVTEVPAALCVSVVGFNADEKCALVEFPRESASGKWRTWVMFSSIKNVI